MTPTKRPTSGVAYLRVSTERQAESGVGLDVQRQAIAAAAEREGITIREWFEDDGISGGSEISERDGLTAALDKLQKGEALVVYRWDRLARSLNVMVGVRMRLAMSKCQLFSAADGWDGCNDDEDDSLEAMGAWMMRTMVWMFAEWERRTIRLRVRAAMRHIVKSGRKGGKVPYGYRAVATDKVNREGRPIYNLEPDADEQAILSRIVEMRNSGSSFGDIAEALNETGRARNGKPWSRGMIHAILKTVSRRKEVANVPA